MMRKFLLFLIVLFAGATAGPAQAPDGLSIASGEAVVARIGADGSVTIVSRGPAPPMMPYDDDALRQLAAITVPPGTKAPGIPMKDGAAKSPSVRAGEIRMTFRDVSGNTPHDALLTVENGYERGLVYSAAMRRGDSAQPTDVCLVMPKKRAYEHWPYRIDRLDLGQFRLVPWKPEDGLPCA